MLLHCARTLQFIALEFFWFTSSGGIMSSRNLLAQPFLLQSLLLKCNVVCGPTQLAMYSARKKNSSKSLSIASNVTFQIKQINIISYLEEEEDYDEFRTLRQTMCVQPKKLFVISEA